MFDSIAQRFSRIFSGLGRDGRLTEKNIEEGIKEVRKALLEADVNLKVVRTFVDRVRKKVLGLETIRGVRGAVRNKEIETGEALDDAGILRVVRTLVKQRAAAGSWPAQRM